MDPPPQTPAQAYMLAALRRDQSKRGLLSCTAEQFFESVRAAILLLDPDVNLVEFFAAIDQALATDRALRAAGRPANAFKELPQRALFKKAIKEALDNERLPPGTRRRREVLRDDELVDRGPDPAAAAIIAERTAIIAEQAAAVHRAMKGIDPKRRKILRLLFDGDCKTQAEVAKKLGIPKSTVNRRLKETLSWLRDRLENDGYDDA